MVSDQTAMAVASTGGRLLDEDRTETRWPGSMGKEAAT